MPQPPRETVMEAKRILIVDDDDDFAASLGDLLHLRGYEIATASCPDEAMWTLAAFNPQVVTIDIRLGNFSGVDLLSQLMSKRPDLICVMITAHADTQTAIAALRQGAYDFYEKTSDPNQLYAILDRCFEKNILVRAHQNAEQEVRTQSLRFEAALNNMSQGLCMFDAAERVVVCNQRYVQMYNLPAELARPGVSWQQIVAHRFATVGYAGLKLEDVLSEHRAINLGLNSALYARELADGRTILISHQPMSEGGWVATHEDITERRRSEARIAHMARHDALTDLPNRLLFREDMERMFFRTNRGETCAVLCLDLDDFKEINDTLGHPVGDALLRDTAERLRGCVREIDTIARLGGDEFAIIQSAIEQPEDASVLARRMIEVISEPHEIQGHQIIVGASIGIALAPNDGADADQLLRNADMALYKAKADGRGTHRFFEPEMDARLKARRALELDMRRALAGHEFELYYQPLLNVATRNISGFEALIRWRHPKRGMIAPAEFIPLVEDTGLIVPLGEWVLHQACAEAVKWPADIKVAVNLSPCQFKSRNLVQMAMSALSKSQLPGERLELEITESVLLQDSESTLAILHELRRLGARISMDDFGTGYSSLSYLRSFPFDKIKIDRSFVIDLEREDAVAIIRAVVGLGASLGMATTAEGVETEEQYQKIAAEGCTEAQGYLFSRPAPADEVMTLLTRFNYAKQCAA